MLRVFVKGCSFPILDISIYSYSVSEPKQKSLFSQQGIFFHQLAFHFVTKPREEHLERPTLYFQPGVRFDIHDYY